MQHPFEGILVPDEISETPLPALAEPGSPDTELTTASRRRFFAKVLGTVAGAAALAVTRASQAQQSSDQPRSNQSETRHHGGEGTVTTRAVGEEGGGQVTTYALGEEGAGGGRPTTYALGEEGAGYPRPRPPAGELTTYALGEEGSWPPPRYRPPPYYRPPWYRYPPPRRYTTQALGEEGGWR